MLRTYVYTQLAGQPLIDACIPTLDPAVPAPALVSSMATPGIVLQYDSDHRADLDAAMLGLGWVFDAEVPS